MRDSFIPLAPMPFFLFPCSPAYKLTKMEKIRMISIPCAALIATLLPSARAGAGSSPPPTNLPLLSKQPAFYGGQLVTVCFGEHHGGTNNLKKCCL